MQALIADVPRVKRSQDRVVLRELAPGHLLFCLADGVGGISGGAQAADMATSTAVRLCEHPLAELYSTTFWCRTLSQIDADVERDRDAGETTAVLGIASHQQLVGASCGDSEAWLVNGGTVDRLTAQQRRKPRIGTGQAIPTSFWRDQPSGRLLVGSDGLFDFTTEETILTALAKPNLVECRSSLLEATTGKGGLLDDVSFVLVNLTTP